MPRDNSKYTSAVNEIEEQYVRSGGNDPYVLTLLTRAHGDCKKVQDNLQKKALANTYETLKESLIRQYNDVELENIKLQYELLSIQQQLKSQLSEKDIRLETIKIAPISASSRRSTRQKKTPIPTSPVKSQPHSAVRPGPENYLSLVQTKPSANMPFLPNLSAAANQMMPFSFPQGFPSILPGLQTGLRPSYPFGNTYIVTGDEVYITPGNRPRIRKKTARNVSLHSPTIGFDADVGYEDESSADYNNESFYEINRLVPQGQYDFSFGILLFFDFAIKLPKEARYCRLSIALVTAGRMKPPISFTALPTEQYSPGSHPEFSHFTTVCRFGYCLAVSGGRPSDSAGKSGINLIAEVMISPDKPADDHVPLLGWIRYGWAPILATRKVFDDDPNLTTCAGRFRVMLRKNLPLTRGEDGLLEFSGDSVQQRVGQRSELFYRIVNSQQAATERLAPVDVKHIQYYDEV